MDESAYLRSRTKKNIVTGLGDDPAHSSGMTGFKISQPQIGAKGMGSRGGRGGRGGRGRGGRGGGNGKSNTVIAAKKSTPEPQQDSKVKANGSSGKARLQSIVSGPLTGMETPNVSGIIAKTSGSGQQSLNCDFEAFQNQNFKTLDFITQVGGNFLDLAERYNNRHL